MTLSPPETGQGLEILVVDDEPHVLEILNPDAGGKRGDHRARRPCGSSATSRAGVRPGSVDWIMGGISGLEVAEAVKRRRRRTVVVLMTGWELKDTPADRHPAIDLVLAKPFDREEIDRIMAEATVLCMGGR